MVLVDTVVTVVVVESVVVGLPEGDGLGEGDGVGDSGRVVVVVDVVGMGGKQLAGPSLLELHRSSSPQHAIGFPGQGVVPSLH